MNNNIDKVIKTNKSKKVKRKVAKKIVKKKVTKTVKKPTKKIIKKSTGKKLSKDDKLVIIKREIKYVPDDYIDKLYDVIKNHKSNETDNNDNTMIIEIDTTSDKYKMALKFVNRILKNLGKEEIDKLTDFKNIDRLDIIKEENAKLVEEMTDDIFTCFDKVTCRYYRRGKIQHYILTLLRFMCKGIGYDFTFKKKEIQTNGVRNSHYFYSVQ